MKALLLGAGLGTRLRPITERMPKCLVPIHAKPLLGYWLELLFNGGIEAVIINTHYLPEQVDRFVLSSPWRERITLVHEPVLLGTGGTIVANKEDLSGGPFLVAHADNLTRFNLANFIDTHKTRPPGVEVTMMTFQTDTPESCGIIEQNGRGVVTGFHEKVKNPPGNLANAAVYLFEPTVIDFLVSLGKPQIDLSTEMLPHFIGRIITFLNTDYHRDIGTPESLRIAESEF